MRTDLLGETPPTWDDVLALAAFRPGTRRPPARAAARDLELAHARRHPRRRAVPRPRRRPGGARRSWPSWRGLGPAEAFGWEPPDALARHDRRPTTIAYIPLTYGYSAYSTGAAPRAVPLRRHARRPGAGPSGAVLGGAGLAVSAATSGTRHEAAAFAAWASGAEAQHDIVARHGGQPGTPVGLGRRRARRARRRLLLGHARDDRPRLGAAARRVVAGPFQLEAGRAAHDGLRAGEPATALTDRLHDLYRRHSG